MKILKVIINTILFLAVIAALFLAILYFKGNKEKKELTDTERKGTSGQYIKLSAGVTHYELAGPDTAKVVILVHGFSVPYFIWDGTFEFLVKQGFRVLRYDMYGRGYSDRPDVVYNNSLYQTQLTDLITQLHLKGPVNLAGISFGGGVITDFTAAHPDLVQKVILVDPVYPFEVPSSPMFFTKYYMATHADEQATGQLTDFKYPQRHPDWVSRYRVQMQYKGYRNALASTRYNFAYNGREINKKLDAAGKQVLLIWGKEDHTVPFNYSDSVRSVLKCDFFPVDDAAHLPYLDQPDKVNAKILAFLRK